MLSLLTILWLTVLSVEYTIHESCQGETRQNVKNAADEALQVLGYAQFRGQWGLQNPLPAQYGDTLMEDMLGGNDVEDWTNAISMYRLSLDCHMRRYCILSVCGRG